MLLSNHEAYTSILLERETEAVSRVKKGIGYDPRRPVEPREDIETDDIDREIV